LNVEVSTTRSKSRFQISDLNLKFEIADLREVFDNRIVTVVRRHPEDFRFEISDFEIEVVMSDRKKTHKASFTVQAQ
jgi:hypothetical protein